MVQEHTVKSFDAEISRLRSMILEMGGLAEVQIADAVKALLQRDPELAQKVIDTDKRLDALEVEVEKMAIQMIALRAPMADDLREILSALKISSILERTGDYAKNVAKRSAVLAKLEVTKVAPIVSEMAKIVRQMLTDILDAYIQRDSAKSYSVWQRDKSVDELYNSLFRELLTYMMENPRLITPCTHILFIAKNLERIGDHSTNIAEIVHFLVEGVVLEENRPKGEDVIYTDVPLPDKLKRS
jgi:phosphate transport system protein